MGKFRIDFVIREVNDDESSEGSRGISFGEEVPAEEIGEFIDRCKDASNVLFNPSKKKLAPTMSDREREKMIAELKLAHLELQKKQQEEFKRLADSQQIAKRDPLDQFIRPDYQTLKPSIGSGRLPAFPGPVKFDPIERSTGDEMEFQILKHRSGKLGNL